MTIFKSSKYEYRVVTAYGDKHKAQFRPHGTDYWVTLSSPAALEDVLEEIKTNIRQDDHPEEEVEIADMDGMIADHYYDLHKANT